MAFEINLALMIVVKLSLVCFLAYVMAIRLLRLD